MEGPTPVSALIHAATMVTAGIFLLVRFNFWYCLSVGILNATILVGGLTAIFAGTVGLFQTDIKKVIAYSTCSQLGYMMLAVGCTAFNLSLFHLFNHAFFKALLFLSAGSVIHALSDEQDMRRYGGLCSLLPVQYVSILVGSLSLIGTPYLAGFYSKDIIPETLLVWSNVLGIGSCGFVLSLLASVLTVSYSVKLIF
jgi:NADH:ubiquinone oxidoreductase subunit 5 (subunit L)/multisubunit Na+/H+ antiporter MnhA subunit